MEKENQVFINGKTFGIWRKGNLGETAIVWYVLWISSIISVYTEDKNYFSRQSQYDFHIWEKWSFSEEKPATLL